MDSPQQDLYFAILSKVEEEDKAWVLDLLRWVTFSENPLSVDALQGIVQTCLEERFVAGFSKRNVVRLSR